MITKGLEITAHWFGQSCSSCGADAYIFEIKAGQFQPIIGKCLSCHHAWPIIRETHAWKKFMEKAYAKVAE
jgi:hypothetical protein